VCIVLSKADVNMTTSDTTAQIINGLIYQVNSSISFKIYYYIVGDQNTIHTFIICRINDELYKPRIKMRNTEILKSTCIRTCVTNLHV
jgi:hypothetical protein